VSRTAVGAAMAQSVQRCVRAGRPGFDSRQMNKASPSSTTARSNLWSGQFFWNWYRRGSLEE
jgi:hypothetical protein